MDVWNYILGYRNTLKSVFETWVVHIPFKDCRRSCSAILTWVLENVKISVRPLNSIGN